MRCENCKFWDNTESENNQLECEGICRIKSPHFMLSQISFYVDKSDWDYRTTHQGCWPITSSDDWCGEFKNKGRRKGGTIMNWIRNKIELLIDGIYDRLYDWACGAYKKLNWPLILYFGVFVPGMFYLITIFLKGCICEQ